MKKGTTLIETLIYISLLAILMTGTLSSVYMILDQEGRERNLNDLDTVLILEKYHQ